MTVGPFQLLIIALIVLLLFGRGRISQSLGEFGHGVRAFRKGIGQAEELAPLTVEAPEAQGTADK